VLWADFQAEHTKRKSMTYYLRYALVDPTLISLSKISEGLQQSDPDYIIDADLLVFKEEEYGQVRIETFGGRLFESDLELMERFARQDENSAFLLAALQKTTSIVVAQVIWSRGQQETLRTVEKMFGWLMENRAGLLMDEDGSFCHALSRSTRE